MSQLIKYEAACRALAECKAIDEVKAWADKAAAMQAYGRMAKDKTLEIDASEIRIRAERRLGEMLAATKAEGGLKPSSTLKRGPVVVANDHGESAAPKLADAGISKDLSSRAQKLAAVPEAEFEAEVGAWRERVSAEGARVSARLEAAGERAQMNRSTAKQKPEQHEDDGPSAEEIAEAMRAQRDDAEAVRLILEADDALAAMTAKCKQQAAQIRILEERIRGLTNEAAQAVRLAKSWRAKCEKLERATA
jgi:hypothetical protein